MVLGSDVRGQYTRRPCFMVAFELVHGMNPDNKLSGLLALMLASGGMGLVRAAHPSRWIPAMPKEKMKAPMKSNRNEGWTFFGAAEKRWA